MSTGTACVTDFAMGIVNKRQWPGETLAVLLYNKEAW